MNFGFPLHRLVGLLGVALVLCVAPCTLAADAPNLDVAKIKGAKPRNVIFILVDDHRYDAMGFLDHPFLKTPNLDALAKGGAYVKNAFVTTSLCSPSRASILTGQYMHNHHVVDNNDTDMSGMVFFPQYLQRAGYATGFFGKWHMGGGTDDPRPGFDKWVSFRGQGVYYPAKNGRTMLNVDGERVPQKGYITDELTDYALEWLDGLEGDKPFFAYISHKAVHAGFDPAERHRKLYSDAKIPTPKTQADTDENYRGKPMWVKNQRNSWHGVDFPYHSDLDVKEYFRDYCRALAGVDENVGRVMKWLEDAGKKDDTLVIYMGDNGFLFGEHGLIDKRNAYEESMRVPMLAHCPEIIKPGSTVEGVVANIDIASTVLEAGGLQLPEQFDGESFLGLLSGDTKLSDWRDFLLYEYYWEYNFPHTPTIFALRGGQYKFVEYWGVWDTDELYDLQADPHETNNLIRSPEHQQVVREMRQALYNQLKETGGLSVQLGFKRGDGANLRRISGSEAADFPPHVMRKKNSQE